MIDTGTEMLKQHFMRYRNTKQQLEKNILSRTWVFPHMLVSIQCCIFKGKSIQLPQNETDFKIHSRLNTDQSSLVCIQCPKCQKKKSNYKWLFCTHTLESGSCNNYF